MFIQSVFNGGNIVRLLSSLYFILYNSFFRNIMKCKVQPKNACIDCSKLHVPIHIICLCVFFCVDS
jgi:hypothetical protein